MISFLQQIKYIVCFLLFGLFLSAMYDILHFYLKKFNFKLIVSYLVQSVFWFGLVAIASLYILKITEGYLTIYTFGFFLIGALIHMYFFSNRFTKDLERFDLYLSYIFDKVKKIVIILVIPKEVLGFLRKIFPKGFIRKTIRKFITAIKHIIVNRRKKLLEKEEAKNEEIISFFDGFDGYGPDGMHR